ncbi:MAG: phosphatidylglycerol lysyltransferase domain-containing protein [Parachlamydiaceae bacterium]
MTSEINSLPLSLDHQELIESFWGPLRVNENLYFAEYSFANVYLFRKQHGYKLITTNPPFVAGVEPELNIPYLIPTQPPEKLHLDVLNKAAEALLSSEAFSSADNKNLYLYPCPDHWLPRMNSTISSSRSETDYLFKANKLKTFGGRALSSRRNLLHQLEAHHTLESKILGEKEQGDAITVLDQWQREVSTTKESNDYYPCKESIERMDRLKLFGRITYADGHPIGFTIGELLSPQTALLHMTKSTHAIKGVTPFLYQDFALHLPESVEWINLEQDLGIPSLRQAKSAYDPDLLLTKWHVKRHGSK